jgi:hypothetical protein
VAPRVAEEIGKPEQDDGDTLASPPAQSVMDDGLGAGSDGLGTGTSNARMSTISRKALDKSSVSKRTVAPTPANCCTFSNRAIDEVELLEKTWWCMYCCCYGLGCGPWVHQRSFLKLTCCLTECERTDVFDKNIGTFSWLYSCCFCHALGQMPRLPGTPMCVCLDEMYWHDNNSRDDFNSRKDKAVTEWEEDNNGDDPAVQTFDFVLMTAYTLCFYKVFGFAVSPVIIRPSLCMGTCKWCCCQCSSEFVPACGEEFGCCTHLLTCTWCYFTCRLPILSGDRRPKKHPVITLCGRKILPLKRRKKMTDSEAHAEESPWYREVELPPRVEEE